MPLKTTQFLKKELEERREKKFEEFILGISVYSIMQNVRLYTKESKTRVKTWRKDFFLMEPPSWGIRKEANRAKEMDSQRRRGPAKIGTHECVMEPIGTVT